MNQWKWATPWRRFAAHILDLCFIILFETILGFFLVISHLSTRFLAISMHGLFFYLSLFVFSWLYYAILESSPLQASLGKRICGLKIVNQEGRRMSFFRASLRFLSVFVSYITLFGHFLIFFSLKRQTLHDKLVKVHVIEQIKVEKSIHAN